MAWLGGTPWEYFKRESLYSSVNNASEGDHPLYYPAVMFGEPAYQHVRTFVREWCSELRPALDVSTPELCIRDSARKVWPYIFLSLGHQEIS